MLIDDVASNKAIGFHGAKHLRSNLEGLEKISVLTHCNTGRLIYLTFVHVSKRVDSSVLER